MPLSATGNKTLHLYTGSIEIVDDGFEVTFFYTGNYRLTITDDEGNVVVSINVSAIANQPIFISADVSVDEDELENNLF